MKLPDSRSRDLDAVISLFSGAGGLSWGFAEAGLQPLVAAEIDADACATYAANLGPHIYNIDLVNPGAAFFEKIDQLKGVLALVGGPPCQGFSSAGMKDGRDSRNQLIFSYLQIVNRTRPRWFLFENVEGLLTSNCGRSVVELVEQFIEIGYRVRLEKINFASYGLPQARKRVVIVGNSLGFDFEMPAPTHAFDAGKHRSGRGLKQAPSFDEAVAGLGPASSDGDVPVPYTSIDAATEYDAFMRRGNNSGAVDLHEVGRVSAHLRRVLAQLRPGQTMKDLPQELWHDSYRRRAFRRVMDGTPTERRGGAPAGVKRLRGELNALTITSAATREFIHPREDRPLTLRESARLQSFPDRFRFIGTNTSVARQIGNAFPPMAAAIIARHLQGLDSVARETGFKQERGRQGALIGFHLTDGTGMSPALTATHGALEELMTARGGMQFDLPLVATSA